MTIVQRYGRKQNYNFDNDENLLMVLNGPYGPKGNVDRNQFTCAFDSFLTIYLVTLPEKFKQWYDFHNFGIQDGYEPRIEMDLRTSPKFPFFERECYFTKLYPRPIEGVSMTTFQAIKTCWNALNIISIKLKFGLQDPFYWSALLPTVTTPMKSCL